MAELKRSINKVQLNGELNEMNLTIETKKTKVSRNIDGNRVEKEVECRVIGKKEFKNPAFTVDINGNIIDVEYFGVNFGVAEKGLDENGNIIDNDRFKALETIMNKYNPKIGGDSNVEPTRVKVDGSLALNEYASVNKNPDGEFYSFPQITAFGISSSGVTEEDSADAEISGVIKAIAHEVRDDEETGRLNVELISFGYNGVAEPFKFVVESDLADDFESFYEMGASVKIYYEIITKQIGGKRVSTDGGFGRRDAKITSGYTITEYSVFRGEEPFEEESEYFVDVETVKNALAEREIMKENRIKDAIEKANNGGTTATKSPKGASKSSGNNPFGNSNAKSSPFGGETKAKNPFA